VNNYNTQEACKILIDFFEVLNNWHIHHGRERFWKSDLDQDKTDAYNVLYTVFFIIYRVIQNDCQGFNNLSYTIASSYRIEIFYFLFFLNRTTLQVLLHTLQVLCMCTLL